MGIANTAMGDKPDALTAMVKDQHRFAFFMTQAGKKKHNPEIPYKAVEIKQRFMAAIG